MIMIYLIRGFRRYIGSFRGRSVAAIGDAGGIPGAVVPGKRWGLLRLKCDMKFIQANHLSGDGANSALQPSRNRIDFGPNFPERNLDQTMLHFLPLHRRDVQKLDSPLDLGNGSPHTRVLLSIEIFNFEEESLNGVTLSLSCENRHKNRLWEL